MLCYPDVSPLLGILFYQYAFISCAEAMELYSMQVENFSVHLSHLGDIFQVLTEPLSSVRYVKVRPGFFRYASLFGYGCGT